MFVDEENIVRLDRYPNEKFREDFHLQLEFEDEKINNQDDKSIANR